MCAIRKIKLSGGQHALIDERDFKSVSAFKWYCCNGYARCDIQKNNKIKRIYMHRLIMNFPDKLHGEVDHINRNKLDNRRSNLRICSHAENSQNNNGKHYHKDAKGWRITINKNGQRFSKRCKSKQEAKKHAEKL